MITQYETAPIPLYTPDNVGNMLGDLVTQRFPGGVIRCASASEAEVVVSDISGYIDSAGGEIKGPMGGSAYLGTQEIGWHIDRRPDASRLMAHVHSTVTGKALARLVVPRPNFWLPETNANPLMLPKSITDRLDQGVVDDEILEPKVYSELLGVGDVLTFVVGGPNPTVHNFTNKTRVRRSAFYAARLPLAADSKLVN